MVLNLAGRRAVRSRAGFLRSRLCETTGIGMYMLHDLADQYAILIVTGLAALVIAGIVFLFSEPGISSETGAAGERERPAPVAVELPKHESVDGRGQRYLEIYRALAASPPDELHPTVPVGLAHEEALGASGTPEPPARQPDLPWPLSARAAKATRSSS